MRLYWKQSPDGTASANLGYWNDLRVEPGSSGWNVLFVNAVVTMSAEEYMALEAPFEEWWADNINADNLLSSVEFR